MCVIRHAIFSPHAACGVYLYVFTTVQNGKLNTLWCCCAPVCIYDVCVCYARTWCACVLTCRSLLCVVCSRCRAADVIVWCGTDVNVDDWPNETGPRWWSEFTQNSRNNHTLKSRLSYWCIHFIGAISEHVFSSRAVCNDSTCLGACVVWLAARSDAGALVISASNKHITRNPRSIGIFGIEVLKALFLVLTF